MPIGHLVVLAEAVEKHALLRQMEMVEAIGATLSKEGQKMLREKADRVFGRSLNRARQHKVRSRPPVVMQDGRTVLDGNEGVPAHLSERPFVTGSQSGYKPIKSPIAKPLSPKEEQALKALGFLHTKPAAGS